MLDQIRLTEINLREEATWGATNIARLARCSVDLIYDWEKLPDCPITKPDGKRYFVLKSAFIRWLTAKPMISQN
jgi:hypothetical protein